MESEKAFVQFQKELSFEAIANKIKGVIDSLR